MIFKGFINWFFFLPTDVGTFSYPHTIAYCCLTVYNSFLKSNLLHQNLSHSSLNLLIRQNNLKLCQESSFVYQNKFNGILKFYRMKIVLCQRSFYILPSLFRSIRKCHCEGFGGWFDCEICKILYEFLQQNFVSVWSLVLIILVFNLNL